MRNQLHSRTVAAGVLALALPAARDARAQNDFLPAKAGNSWTYFGNLPQGKGEMTATILASKPQGKGQSVILQWAIGDQPFQDEHYLVNETEIARARSGVYGANRIAPAIPIVRTPLSVGKSWSWKGRFTGGPAAMDASCTMKVAALEELSTKAGKFKAYRVEFVLTLQDKLMKKSLPSTYWFAQGVGVVKQKTQLADGKAAELVLVKRNFK